MVSKVSRGVVPVILAVILVVAVAHVASSKSTGFGGHMGHHGMHGGMDALGVPLPLLLRTANLTDAQKTQIHARSSRPGALRAKLNTSSSRQPSRQSRPSSRQLAR